MTTTEIPVVLAEIKAGDVLKFAAVGRQCSVNPVAVWRWHKSGVQTARGVVKLEAVRCGSSFRTSQAAVDRFIMALSTTPDEVAVPTVPNPRKTAARSVRAAKKLASMGA